MTAYVALLRAVNVGGTGKLPMTELKAMCEACGFRDAKTYIASGNVSDEEIALGKREIHVHYGDGIGKSKLKIPAATAGTAHNMNTVAKLAEMASALLR